jgi:uncharacterized membrane protein YeaQ/YmgE (transglycosylase-associated protein family)
MDMIDMRFLSFLILLVISVVVSAVLHYGCKYYVTPGPWSFASKVVVGWIGAWIGTPVLGTWPRGFPYLRFESIYIIPAILGALGLLVVAIDVAKMRNSPRTS